MKDLRTVSKNRKQLRGLQWVFKSSKTNPEQNTGFRCHAKTGGKNKTQFKRSSSPIIENVTEETKRNGNDKLYHSIIYNN